MNNISIKFLLLANLNLVSEPLKEEELLIDCYPFRQFIEHQARAFNHHRLHWIAPSQVADIPVNGSQHRWRTFRQSTWMPCTFDSEKNPCWSENNYCKLERAEVPCMVVELDRVKVMRRWLGFNLRDELFLRM